MKKQILTTIIAVLLFAMGGTAYSQVQGYEVGCVPFQKSDGKLYCDTNWRWDDANDQFILGGTNITSTAAELNILDGVTATEAEIDRVADVSARIVTLTGDVTMTVAANDGKINLLGEVGGDASLTVTLPEATATGACYHFVVSVVNTSNYVILVTSDDTIDGSILSLQDAADTVVGWETAATTDTITLNGTTQGGVSIGDWVKVCDIATDQYSVTGVTTSSGTEVTPFSAGVS